MEAIFLVSKEHQLTYSENKQLRETKSTIYFTFTIEIISTQQNIPSTIREAISSCKKTINIDKSTFLNFQMYQLTKATSSVDELEKGLTE